MAGDYIPLRQNGDASAHQNDENDADTYTPQPHKPRRNRHRSRRHFTIIAGGTLALFLLFIVYNSADGEKVHAAVGKLTGGSGGKATLYRTENGYLNLKLPRLTGLKPGGAIKVTDVHPITMLIEEAKEKKRVMEEKKDSVRSLEDAVRDYRESFGMDPPEGFDAWFEFATSIQSTRVPSLLPEAHLSILPYLSLPAHLLRSRALDLQKDDEFFGMVFYPDGVQPEEADNVLEGTDADGLVGVNRTSFMVSYMSPRWDYPKLLAPIIPLIPLPQQPTIPLQMTMCVRDGGCRLSSGKVMEMAREKARNGGGTDTFSVEELEELEATYIEDRGWSQTCLPALDRQIETAHVEVEYSSATKSFIDDHLQSMDFCKEPELIRLNGEMIMEGDHVMRPLAPALGVSRPMHGADMIGTPTRAVTDLVDHVPWSDKTKRQVVWRGTMTGAFHRDRWDWRSSQRHRLSHLVGNATNEEVPVLVERLSNNGEVMVEKWREDELVKHWLDVGVIKEDIHNLCGPGPTGEACRLDGGPDYPECPEYEPSCDEMQEEYEWVGRVSTQDTLAYRYRLDVDGYGWSSRFQKLLSTNSVILKSTLYPEWWSAQAIPYYHYIPLSYTYTDIFDILFYLDGSPDGSTPGREDVAERIAKQGGELLRENLRWEDMQSYMLLLLLEYRRAWSDDRAAATYKG